MRQLVSVVTQEAVSYYLAEDGSDEVHQVAQVLNTGLAVPEVIDLGANLLDALKLNGHKPRKLAQPEPPVALAPAPPEPAPPARKVKAARRAAAQHTRTAWGLSHQAVLADIQAHPGTTYLDITRRLTGGEDQQAKASVSAHVGALIRKGHAISLEYETVRKPDSTGRRAVSVQIAHLTYVSRREEPHQPELDQEQ